MSEVEEREERFLDALAQLDDNVLQHEYILSFASCLDMLVPEECTDENALTGCTADAWLELREDGAGLPCDARGERRAHRAWAPWCGERDDSGGAGS